MTGIYSYSTTPANNVQANTGINWDEGMPPAAVNNSARQNMTDLRNAFNDLAWFKYGKGDQDYSPVYASGTSFTIAGTDVTSTYHAGRRVRAVGSGTGTIYGVISSSSFSTNTTVNVTWDSGSLSNESLTISLCQIPATGKPVSPSCLSSTTGSGNVVLSASPTFTGTLAAADVTGSGNLTGAALIPSGSSAPSNGMFLPASNTVGFAVNSSEQFRVSSTGRFLVNTTTGTGFGNAHAIVSALTADAGNIVLWVGRTSSNPTAQFSAVSASGYNSANAALFLGKDNLTGRSASTGGTVNTSGADYAEYEVKADHCGNVAKGQVIGFDAEGKVTDNWEWAISFGVKSTNPNLVGGDVWADGIERPHEPDKPEPPPDLMRHESETDDEWSARNISHAAAVTKYGKAVEEYIAAKAKYDADKKAFDASIEAARQTVDRIAYCGKCPVNVSGAIVGDYIIAEQDGDGIKGVAVRNPSFEQYLRAVGRVRRILPDGRPEIAVIVT